MKKNSLIGGSQTNKNGLRFEKEVDFAVALDTDVRFSVEEIKFDDKKSQRGFEIRYNDSQELIGRVMPKSRFYDFLDELNIDWQDVNSKQWQPDDVFINELNRTVYIIEKKWQENDGSVDEKLFGFGNKRRLYQRLLDTLENPYTISFVFIGNSDFWNKDKYRDTFEMLRGDGVKIMLDEYDLTFFGLIQ